MKQFGFIILLLLSMVSCDKTGIDVQNEISKATCLTQTKSTQKSSTLYFEKNGDDMQVRHNGVWFNCSCEQFGIRLKTSINGKELIFQEIEASTSANCTCEFDINLVLKQFPLDNYVVHIVNQNGDDLVIPFDVDFKKGKGEVRFASYHEGI